MPATTGFEFGDLVLVPFPFTDQSTTSAGPLSSSAPAPITGELLDLIILAVTSQVRAAPAVGEAAIACWKEAGLLKPSVLKPLIATIEKELVLRRLGRLEEGDRHALRGVLDAILGQ
jgi:mRNA interferase MazF